MKKTILSLVLITTSPAILAGTQNLIKKTNSGLCHDVNSGHYQRTKNYIPFDSMESCINSGGKAYKGYSSSSSTLNDGDYDRKLYAHWRDSDSDCQDARTETLISQSVSPVTFKTDRGCKAIKGAWNDPYSGNRYYNASDLDIDHVVTLAWAHEHGGREMSPETKEKFANDPINLIAVDKYLNRQKGAKPPMEWMPPNKAFHCQYVTRFQRVLITYNLKFTNEEKIAFLDLKKSVCKK